MATNYLGQNGLVYLITLIKNSFVKKVLKTGSDSEYKGLSDNDLTDTLKAQYDAAYTHSTTPHAPAGAEANVLESVKVNGQALPVTAKAVDVPVPLISTNISADATSDLKAASPKAVAGYVSAGHQRFESRLPEGRGGVCIRSPCRCQRHQRTNPDRWRI